MKTITLYTSSLSLESGTLVRYHVAKEDVIGGPDEAEFFFGLELALDDEEDDVDSAGIISSCAFGIIFLFASLSFHDARPREASIIDYDETDSFTIGDLFDGLQYKDGTLRYYGDYVRGRRLKTGILLRPDGTVRLQTTGRGKAALRWLPRQEAPVRG
jgi:hypothetical protein